MPMILSPLRHAPRLIASCSALMLLAACGGSSRPTYSGHQESTEGVPGFKDGKKQSPHVKLGQSYTVNGETYVPRFQPDYKEEGMASWYGPGFDGGKTANGEIFDKHALTGAHRTLPLPSMVRVTMLSTGQSAIVRINDRGPFHSNRLIDLSYGAAKAIGLLGKGVAKVRVEYLHPETEKLAELMAQGRHPAEIDIAQEVMQPVSLARNQPTPRASLHASATSATPADGKTPWWKTLNPVASANAQESEPAARTQPYQVGGSDDWFDEVESRTPAPQDDLEVSDLPPPVPGAAPAPPATKTANAPAKSIVRPAARVSRGVAMQDLPAKPIPFGAPSKPLSPEELAPPPRESSPLTENEQENAHEVRDAEAIEAEILEEAEVEAAARLRETSSDTSATQQTSRTPAPADPNEAGAYFVQIGAFSRAENAAQAKAKAAALGEVRVEVIPAPDGGRLHRVRIGPFFDVDESQRVLARAEALGINGKVVR